MISQTSEQTRPAEQANWKPNETAAHGPVHLDVTDGERSLHFWRDVLGLQILGQTEDEISVGTGGRVLLVLHPGADSPSQRGHAGLYHVAVHVPDAAEFAYVLARLLSARYPNRPTEHVFSKATYLDDLDGNGVEITLETPERVKDVDLSVPGRPELIDADGNRLPPVGHLDLEEVMSHLEEKGDRPLKPGTWIGHVHLHINDLEQARHFYSDLLGFQIGLDTPEIGMLDVHFEGEFKHRIAFNDWQGPVAAQRPEGMAGLRHVTLVFPGGDRLAAAVKRLKDGGYPTEVTDEGLMVHDPAGNVLLLVALSGN
ncbi:MAG: VOC family protein [Thermoleophilia bacterium]|nr:VOC family protein [Thermoleophilia bacterium]